LENYIHDHCNRINEQLNLLIPKKSHTCSTLFDAARYALLGTGKRIRPLFGLAATETLGGDKDLALKPLCVLELIHAYSLIHDDLPCMDDDDFRRGKPSLHRAYPEGIAVLTGDFLLTYAFEILAETHSLSLSQRVQLISLLAKSAGAFGMIGGQVMDIESENKSLDLDTLKQIHNYKTGALIQASIEFGAIISNAPLKTIEALRVFSSNIGLAFQIVDDILDVTHSKEKKGKEVSSDQKNHKTTFVTLLGLNKAKDAAVNLLDSAHQNLQQLPIDTTLLHSLADLMVNRTT
jgi:geranylgeranyl diphosphate synthase type II